RYLVQTHPALCQLAADGVAAVEAGPGQTGGLVGAAQVGGEVVRIPPAPGRCGEVPAVVGRGRGVPVEIAAQRPAEGDSPVGAGFGLPASAVDCLGAYPDQALPSMAAAQVNVLPR